ncbi:MAG: bifunctional metallophosphatase/5'-nucleotidase [Sinimarinibacterium flocculans]|uniref:bifunctional metallophosphatase/5'-nucleotidase n=2 Tax=Sinimarinibacterium flocculans TaxID=985250 RepID=UPI003C4DD84E
MSNPFRWLAAGLVCLPLMLAGCDGDDGAAGAPGPAGPQGPEGPAGEAPATPLKLTILHINDHHSHLLEESFDFDVSALELGEAANGDGDPITEVEVSYGGMPRLVELFGRLEANRDNVLKIHAGDAITGTLFYTLYEGTADAQLMNLVCFDVFELGNHEFDSGDAGLAFFLDELASGICETDVLGANVVPGENSPLAARDYIKPYVIREIGGQKVGLIGIDIAQKTQVSSRPDPGTVLLDELETAQANIDLLTAEGIDKIILVTHQGYLADIALAEALTGVDVIVGGDSHTLLGGEGLEQLGFAPEGDYPTIVQNADGDDVCIVQAWEYAHVLGELNVEFDEDGVVTSCAGVPYLPTGTRFNYEFDPDTAVDGDEQTRTLTVADADGFLIGQALDAFREVVLVDEDPFARELLAGFGAQVDVLTQQVIGSAAEDLCLARFPGDTRGQPLCTPADTYEKGSDISNVVAEAFMSVTPTADIGFQNGGGVRINVPAGDVTIADVYTLLPFSNTLVVLTLSGQEIVDSLEEGLSNVIEAGGSDGAYPYAAGLRYEVDMSKAAGSRISNVEINRRLGETWQPIDLDADYTVVTNDFLAASGGDGYQTFKLAFDEGRVEDTQTEYAQGFVDYLQQLTGNGGALTKPDDAEYSTQNYVDIDGCDHGASPDCGLPRTPSP